MNSSDGGFGPRAIIDLGAIKHNLGVVRARAPTSKVMAVVKANGYGHGIVPIARALGDADAFGVARLPEALALRAAGLVQSIVLLEGVFAPEELDAAAANRLEIVIHSIEQLAMFESWRGTNGLRVWLKIDTGMNRLGFRVEDFANALTRLKGARSVDGPPRLMTHLACADETANTRTSRQVEAFRALAHGSGLEQSIANSAGLLAWPDARADWVRPGLMLYGISPFAGEIGSQLGLRPAMTLKTRVIAVRSLVAGDEVGYGGLWRASKPSRLGIAAIGYGDGYPRQIGSGSPVRVGDREAWIAGRVSMDMIAIDLQELPNAQVGDEVTLWGAELPVERMAACAGTIPYELVCGISQRVTVEYA